MKVAVAGLGFMGATHLKAWKQVPAAHVIGVTSSNARKLTGDLTAVGGNFGGPGEMMDFSNIRKYRSLEEVLGDPEIDAVDICLPTDQHGKAAIAALRAGKHVLIEKPMAMDEAETGSVLNEARCSGRTLMVGQILRFSPAYVALADATPDCRAGSFGFLQAAVCRSHMEPLANRSISQRRRDFRSSDPRRRLLHFEVGYAGLGSRGGLRGSGAGH
jgi:predicted dehydrogenase